MAQATEKAKGVVNAAQQSSWGSVIKDTGKEWTEDKAPRLGAALAYYAVFSLAPLLMIAIAIAGFVFGEQAARGQLTDQLKGLFGEAGASAVQEMLKNAHSRRGTGIIATVTGVITLLLGASGVFGQLQGALNTIWGVEKKPGGGIGGMIKDRISAFAMVLGIGFLLMASLVASAVLTGLAKASTHVLPISDGWIYFVDIGVSLIAITVLFGVIFKYLPDVKIAWSNVWIGAIATAVLFVIGKFAIGWYLGRSSINSSYGPAASLVIVLLWVYYSAQILFLGAEFTQVYAKKRGTPVLPSENAIPIEEALCDENGAPKERTRKAAAGPPRKTAKRETPVTSAVSPRSEQQQVPNESANTSPLPEYRPIPNFREGKPLRALVPDLLPRFLAARVGRKILNKMDQHHPGQA